MTYCTRLRVPLALVTLVLAVLGDAGRRSPTSFFASAHAADPANVEALIRQGNLLRNQGKEMLALPYFQKAYETERNPRTAAQLGLVEGALGYWLASERHLTEGLSSKRHPWVERTRSTLEAALRNSTEHIGEIEVSGSPNGAEVLLNNKVIGTLPMRPVRAEEGAAQVLVRSSGFVDHSASANITGGKRESIVVSLVRAAVTATEVPDGAPPPPPRSVRGDQPSITRAGLASRSIPEEHGSKSGAPAWVRPVSWVAGTMAVAALGFGGYQWLEMSKNQDAFNKHMGTAMVNGVKIPDCSTGAPNRGAAGCQTLYEKTVSTQRLAIAGFQVGGVLAVASIIGFVWSANSSADSSESAAAPSAPTVHLAFDHQSAAASAGLNWRF